MINLQRFRIGQIVMHEETVEKCSWSTRLYDGRTLIADIHRPVVGDLEISARPGSNDTLFDTIERIKSTLEEETGLDADLGLELVLASTFGGETLADGLKRHHELSLEELDEEIDQLESGGDYAGAYRV